jgi:hypothetical protein
MSSRSPVSGESRRLDAIQQRLERDSVLQLLLAIAASGTLSFDLPISLLVDGVILKGRIARPEAIAAQLDQRVEHVVRTAVLNVTGTDVALSEDRLATIREAMMNALSGAFTANLAAYRKREDEAQKKLDAELGTAEAWDPVHPPLLDDLPDSIVHEFLFATAPFTSLTLDQAEIYSDRAWQPLGLVRVAIAHIGAWWLPDQ